MSRPATRPVKIQCEADAGGDSLIGSASRSGGEVYEFTGWLGLIGALQALLVEGEAK